MSHSDPGQQVRARVLRWFARAGLLDPTDVRDMAGWHHGGGFSLDASVRIEGHDRAGLERPLRYCARPPFALERLEQLAHDQLVYRFPKPQPDCLDNEVCNPRGWHDIHLRGE